MARDKDEDRNVNEFIGTVMKGKKVVAVNEEKVKEGKYILVRRQFHLDSGGYFWKEFYRSKRREDKIMNPEKYAKKSKKGGDSDEDSSDDEDVPQGKADTDILGDEVDLLDDGSVDMDFLDGLEEFVQVGEEVRVSVNGLGAPGGLVNTKNSVYVQRDQHKSLAPSTLDDISEGGESKKKKKKGRSSKTEGSDSPRPKVKRNKSKKGGKKKKEESELDSFFKKQKKKKSTSDDEDAKSRKSTKSKKSTKSSKSSKSRKNVDDDDRSVKSKKKKGDKPKKKKEKKKSAEPEDIPETPVVPLEAVENTYIDDAQEDMLNFLEEMEAGLSDDDLDDSFLEDDILPPLGDEDPMDLLRQKADQDAEEARKPVFMKIMGVWEQRKDKVAYSAPLQTMGGKSAAASDNPFEARMERMKVKTDADNPAPKEAAPDKFVNQQAESIDFSKPYTRPVYQKSTEEVELIADTVQENAAFQGLDEDQIKPLVDAFEPKMFKSGAVIAKAGAPERFYSIVESGEVDFYSEGVLVGSAKAGQSFGDMALQGASAQAVSAVARGEGTVLLQIENDAFRHIVRDEMIKSENDKVQLLKSVDMFKDLDEQDLAQLSEAMVPRKFRKGENITRKFKEMPFCIIQQGSVVATDVEIGAGKYIGEEALTAGEEKVAKVSALAKTAGVAFTIDPVSFRKVFGDYDRLKRKNEEQKALMSVRSIRDAGLMGNQVQDLVAQLEELRFEPNDVICEKGEETKPLMYLVRSGKIKVTNAKGEEQTVLPGGFFGTENMEHIAAGKIPDYVVADFTAVAAYDSICGILSLQDLAAVTGAIRAAPPQKCKIGLDDLNRHRLLGEGQYGQVWLVTDKHSDDPEPLALKIQQLKTAKNYDRTESIRKETKLMRALQHQFIVRLLNVYKSETEMSMLMTIAPGGELFDVIHRQTDDGYWISGMNEPCAKFYTAIIADTLAYMHKQKYLYRDLKPENILIDSDGYPVLTDFGFAKKLEADKTYTFCGTPNFVAPEVILQRGHDGAADNWSLGVLIFEMVDGDNPFWEEGMDNGTLYDVICHSPHFPLPEHVSVEAEHLITRLLEKNPSKRIGTFREKDILEHEWFDQVDMDDVRAKKIKAPKIPDPIEF